MSMRGAPCLLHCMRRSTPRLLNLSVYRFAMFLIECGMLWGWEHRGEESGLRLILHGVPENAPSWPCRTSSFLPSNTQYFWLSDRERCIGFCIAVFQSFLLQLFDKIFLSCSYSTLQMINRVLNSMFSMRNGSKIFKVEVDLKSVMEFSHVIVSFL